MTIKQRFYDEAVGLLRLLRHDARSSCDVIFASSSWKSKHAAHSHIVGLTSKKLADDLINLRQIADKEKCEQEGVGRHSKELVVDVPEDVCEEGLLYV